MAGRGGVGNSPQRQGVEAEQEMAARGGGGDGCLQEARETDHSGGDGDGRRREVEDETAGDGAELDAGDGAELDVGDGGLEGVLVRATEHHVEASL
ncbi:unnamed protein product [Urochloa humidicola]